MDISKILNSLTKRINLSKIRRIFFTGNKESTGKNLNSSKINSYLIDSTKFEQGSSIRKNSIVNLGLDMRAHIEDGVSNNISGLGARLRLEVPDREDVYFREYSESDPPSKIDWKVYARSDNLIIRQTKGQAHLRVLIVIDLSQSMKWKKTETDISKEALSFRVAAFMSRVHLEKEDELYLSVFKNETLVKTYKIRNFDDCLCIYNQSLKEDDREELDTRLVKEDTDTNKNKGIDKDVDLKKYDLIYEFSDALSPGYKRFISNVSLFFHTLSIYELDPRWMKDTSVYYARRPHISYTGSKILDGKYPVVVDEWIKGVKKEIVKKCDYFLLHEMVGTDELIFEINSIFKERRNRR